MTAPTAPAEPLLDVDGVGALGGEAARERAGVAAVEQQQDPAGPRAVHRLVHERRGHGARLEQVELGVPRRKVELAAVVLHPVTGEVHQQQVVRLALLEEASDGEADLMPRLVDDGLDIEPADVGISEHVSEGISIPAGGPQARETRIVVRVGRDDQGAPSPGHGSFYRLPMRHTVLAVDEGVNENEDPRVRAQIPAGRARAWTDSCQRPTGWRTVS